MVLRDFRSKIFYKNILYSYQVNLKGYYIKSMWKAKFNQLKKEEQIGN